MKKALWLVVWGIAAVGLIGATVAVTHYISDRSTVTADPGGN